jgi:hypothetical protein
VDRPWNRHASHHGTGLAPIGIEPLAIDGLQRSLHQLPIGPHAGKRVEVPVCAAAQAAPFLVSPLRRVVEEEARRPGLLAAVPGARGNVFAVLADDPNDEKVEGPRMRLVGLENIPRGHRELFHRGVVFPGERLHRFAERRADLARPRLNDPGARVAVARNRDR